MSTPEDLLGFDTPESFPEPDEFAVSKSGEKKQYIRGDRFGIEDWADPKKMITFMNKMQTVPLDAIDDAIVHESYTAMMWLLREAAVNGDLKAVTAREKWLEWAKPIINRSKAPKELPASKGSVAFMPREPSSGEER